MVYIMNFFNKYKDLFGVPEGTPLPKSKLTVNNGLFIDKPFVPTYQETLSINSKLRDLRKDYNQLEQEIQSINVSIKTPRRASSRKGKQFQQIKQKDREVSKNMMSLSLNNQAQGNSPFLKFDRRKDNKMQNSRVLHEMQPPLEPNIQSKDPFAKKRIPWLKDEQVNLAKHSEMNYIFNHKIKQEYPRTKNISEMPMPKAQNFMFGAPVNPSTYETSTTANNIKFSTGNRNEPNRPAQRTRILQTSQSLENMHSAQTNMKKRQSGKGDLDYDGAMRRRDQAKRNIKSRRQKLGYMYRTSW